MVTITISEWFIHVKVSIMSFPKKINAKSLFSLGHSNKVWIDAEKTMKKTTSSLPPLKRKIANLHRTCKNNKTKDMAPF